MLASPASLTQPVLGSACLSPHPSFSCQLSVPGPHWADQGPWAERLSNVTLGADTRFHSNFSFRLNRCSSQLLEGEFLFRGQAPSQSLPRATGSGSLQQPDPLAPGSCLCHWTPRGHSGTPHGPFSVGSGQRSKEAMHRSPPLSEVWHNLLSVPAVPPPPPDTKLSPPSPGAHVSCIVKKHSRLAPGHRPWSWNGWKADNHTSHRNPVADLRTRLVTLRGHCPPRMPRPPGSGPCC